MCINKLFFIKIVLYVLRGYFGVRYRGIGSVGCDVLERDSMSVGFFVFRVFEVFFNL